MKFDFKKQTLFIHKISLVQLVLNPFVKGIASNNNRKTK